MTSIKINSKKDDGPQYRGRFRLLLLLLLGVALLIVFKVTYLQVYLGDFLRKQGDARTLRVDTISAHRGMIMDRQGEPLAVSTPVKSLWGDPQELVNQSESLPVLAKALALDTEIIVDRIARNAQKEFIYLKRHMAPVDADKVLALEIPGVYSREEYRRYYPASEVTSHLIGFTDVDDTGQEGMELAYESWLKGVPGKKRVLKDRLGRTVKDIQTIETAKPGNNLILSIDQRLQYLAYRELKAAVIKHKAKSGSLVMLDAKTGEVLAMVNQPSYNPNDRTNLKISHLRNRAITDVFEPGSTVKPFTIAAALSSGKYTPNTMVNTNPGYFRVQQKIIRDHHNYGTIDVATVITKSSNIGASKLALSIDSKIIWSMFNRAGLGHTTGTGFPGESVGLLPNRIKWRPIEMATLSYGYGLSVTPLQLAQAYTAFANQGIRKNISLVKLEQADKINNSEISQVVMSQQIANKVLAMLETVTQPGGTGTQAKVPGYRVAGKTGTVHLIGSDGYEENKYLSVFAGLAPVSNPRVVAVIIIKEPTQGKYYGGDVAAPVFASVVSGTLRLLNVAPDALAKIAQEKRVESES